MSDKLDHLNRQCAEIKGWFIPSDYRDGGYEWYFETDKDDLGLRHRRMRVVDWHPTTSIEQAFQVADRVIKMGLEEEYGKALQEEIFHFPGVLNNADIVVIAHATPIQRCRACVKAWEERK